MLHDIRYAIRTFVRAPGFTLVTVLTLALGIGATTAIFSVVYAVLLKPLPYADADRLVVMRGSMPDLHDLADASRSFDGMAVWATNLYNLEAGGETEQVLGGVISSNLLPLLGVEPVLGRNFTPDEADVDSVILSYGLWQSRFGGDPNVIGRSVSLSGSSYPVVGVAPAWFRFPNAEFRLWTNIASIETKAPKQARNRALRIFSALGHLKPSTTVAQAQAEAAAIMKTLADTYPATNAQVEIELRPLYEVTVGAVRPALGILMATVVLLLLIACANVANLMLARVTVREQEIGIRMALGASRARLARHLLAESLVLALAGGAVGVLVALWGADALPSLLEARVPRAEGIRIDASVLAFALGATLLTAFVFGIAPALQAVSASAGALKEGSRTLAGTPRGRRTRRTIVVAEIALAVLVLVGAGLLTRSFALIVKQDPGFDPTNVLSFNVQFVKLPDDQARARAAAAILERLAATPGVQAVGAATGLPIVTAQRGTRFEVDGRTLGPDEDGALFIAATPGYFEALHTPLLRGRTFNPRDDLSAQPVVLINRTLARRIFGDRDAVGRRLRILNPEQSDIWRTIAGIVDDVHYEEIGSSMRPTVYSPFAQTPFLWMYVIVRTTADSRQIGSAIRSLVPEVDPTLRAADLRSMTNVIAASIAEPRLNMQLVAGFAVLALLLATIGIYGVVSYSVAQRRHEIGVRMALGAASRDVLRLVAGEGLGLAIAGAAFGLAGAAAVTGWMEMMLFGVTPRDPVTFAVAAAALVIVAAAASLVPALRATRVEPLIALKAE